MRIRASHILLLASLLVFSTNLGCQNWQAATALSSLTSTKGERLIKKQAKNDPFPSPSDVGFEVEEANQ